jgi:tetratricopeptide (TPR) repeat protein
MRFVVSFATFFSILAMAGPASAAEAKSDAAVAKHHFDQGTKAFNLGEFARATTEYKAAYEAKSDPVFLYNIAQAYRLAGDLTQALFFYRSFLRNLPTTPNRREVEGRIRSLEEQVANQHSVTTQPPNSTVPPGGVPSSSEASEPPTAARAKPVEPAADAPAATEAGASSSSTAGELTATAPRRADKQSVAKKWWLWTAVGVVAVGAGLGIGLGLGLNGSHAPSSQLGTTPLF